MNIELPGWLSDLGESGWIAILLLLAFVVILTVTIVMIWKLFRDNRQPAAKKDQEDELDARLRQESTLEPPARKPPPPAAPDKHKPGQQSPTRQKDTDEEVDAVAEAEVYLTYGLHKQAINVLAKHLAHNPSDKRASDMLEQAKKNA